MRCSRRISTPGPFRISPDVGTPHKHKTPLPIDMTRRPASDGIGFIPADPSSQVRQLSAAPNQIRKPLLRISPLGTNTLPASTRSTPGAQFRAQTVL